MIIKYRTGSGYGGKLIEKVECQKESEKCVWVERWQMWADSEKSYRRADKRSRFENYFDTWEEAHAYLIEQAERRLQNARADLQEAQGFHGNVVGLKKPEE